MLIGQASAAGIWMNGPKSDPPASMTITECLPSSDSRKAMAEPADPEPMMTKSA